MSFPPPYPSEPVPRQNLLPPDPFSGLQQQADFARRIHEIEGQPEKVPPPSSPPPPPSAPAYSWADEDEKESKFNKVFSLAVAIFIALVVIAGIFLFVFRKNDTLVSESPEGTSTIPFNEKGNENLILAREGGTVSGDGAYVVIPAGALAQDTLITIRRIAAGEITNTYLLEPEGLKFLKPVTVVFPYNPPVLQQRVEVEYKIGGKKRSIPFIVDVQERSLRAEVMEF